MKAMQEIQPEVKRLQKELKGDREELNKQLMALYQERGVNPAAGCLPLIAQMPVWFALFQVLRVSVVEGRVYTAIQDIKAFVGLTPNEPIYHLTGDIFPVSEEPIGNLARALTTDGTVEFLSMDLLISPSEAVSSLGIVGALPYLVLVAMVIVFGYYQQLQTTRRRKDDAEQNPQAQSMQTAMKIMPLFLGFISWGFPTGLVLYFAVSALFRIGQQGVILYLDDRDSDGDRATPVPVDPEPVAAVTPRGPAPNTSKKRKQRRRK
jgi:YidC/Oxa1 family membrane protein insertase